MCSVGGGADERAEAIAIDSSGNSYMVGRFNSNFIGSGNSAINPKVGVQDVFVIKTTVARLALYGPRGDG